MNRSRGWLVGEFFGTFLLVFFGCGSVAAAVLMSVFAGIFQVAIIWGLGVATAIYLTSSLSGAHLNPAVTCALAAWGKFPARRVAPYIAAQFAGAFAAAAVVHAIFMGPLASFETAHGIVRGAVGSEASAMIFGEYFPNPGGKALTDDLRAIVTPGAAFLAEAIGTALLMLVIFAVTDERNRARPRELGALTIGLTITLLISLLAPLTQAGFNPARDLAPRLWSALAGWRSAPFAANGLGWLTVYVFGPLLGAQVGGILYRVFFRPAYVAADNERARGADDRC
jgi:glycerol uptake facilitator protein